MNTLKNIIKWMFLWGIIWPVLIVAFILYPLIILFAKNGHLPKWLRWFETYDHDLYGDLNWKEWHPNYKSYWWQLMWVYRNPIGVFSYEVAGLAPEIPFRFVGDRQTANKPIGHSGVVWATGSNCFLFYLVYQWPYKWCPWTLLQTWLQTHCLRVAWGWKMFAELDGSVRTKPAQLILGFNPFMSFDLD